MVCRHASEAIKKIDADPKKPKCSFNEPSTEDLKEETRKKLEQILMCLYCTFIEFPNHIMSKMRQPCNQQLAKEVPTKDGIVFRPLLIYPTINIKDQLRLLYS